MDPLCPQCQKAIARADVSLAQGLAYCAACKNYFKLSEQLVPLEEVRRIERPANSTISIELGAGYGAVHIPSKGWDLRLVLPVFILCITILLALPASVDQWFVWPTLLLGLFLLPLIWVVPSFARIRVVIGTSVSVQWSLMGLAWTKRRPIADLVKISEHAVRTSEDKEHLGVGLFFADGYCIGFGTMLEDLERKWLIGELQELVVRQLAARERELSASRAS